MTVRSLWTGGVRGKGARGRAATGWLWRGGGRMRGRGARDCSTGRGRTCERRGAGGEGTRATRPVPGGAVGVEGRRRRRAETAPRRRGCGTSGRRRACSGVAAAGGRGRGTRAGGRCSAPSTHTCGAEAGAAGSRSARATVGRRAPADVRCISRGKRAARGQGESPCLEWCAERRAGTSWRKTLCRCTATFSKNPSA